MDSKQLHAKWQELMNAKLKNIKTLKDIEASDPNVETILVALRGLHKSEIDVIGENILLNTGGRLLGAYTSVGVTSSIKRAERDAAEQSYEEMLSTMSIMNKGGEIGITEARALAKEQLSEFATEIVWREQIKNSYEAITDATEKTISFLQSVLKIKNNERMFTNKFSDQTNP